MVEMLSQHYGDIIIIAAIGLLVSVCIANLIHDKKPGIPSCGKSCSCSGCALAGRCHTQ